MKTNELINGQYSSKKTEERKVSFVSLSECEGGYYDTVGTVKVTNYPNT
jgi:hypothetical protein